MQFNIIVLYFVILIGFNTTVVAENKTLLTGNTLNWRGEADDINLEKAVNEFNDGKDSMAFRERFSAINVAELRAAALLNMKTVKNTYKPYLEKVGILSIMPKGSKISWEMRDYIYNEKYKITSVHLLLFIGLDLDAAPRTINGNYTSIQIRQFVIDISEVK